MVVRGLEGLKQKVRARTVEQKARIRAATAQLMQEEFELDQGLVPRDTNYLANHMVGRLTRGGYNYFVGFLRGEFVGEINPVTGKVVTEFYAVHVIRGTRHMAGRDFLTEGRTLMRQRIRDVYRRALRG